MKRLFWALAIFAAVGFAISVVGTRQNPASNSTQNENDQVALTAAQQLNSQWKNTYDKTGHFPERQNPAFHKEMLEQLRQISFRHPNDLSAKELLNEYLNRQEKINATLARIEKVRIENDASGRKSFSENLDTTFLKAGRDVHISVSGPKNTILRINYVLLNRPAVYQIQNETDFLERAWRAGFKRVILGDGYTSAWEFKAPR